MLATKIRAKARETPDKTAIVFNNRELSYRRFACLIEISRRYLAAQGLAGEGVAVLPSGSLMSTWILGLALHSLGMTTLAVSSAEEIGRLNLPDIRCVVATAGAHPGLDHICAAGGWRLLRVPAEIIDGATAQGVVLDLPDLSGPFGGHILLTSGTTGSYKKVFFDPAQQWHRFCYLQGLHGITDQSLVNVLNFGMWTSVGYYFAASTWDAGGTVVIYQGRALHDAFRWPGISHTYVIPHLLAQILAAPDGALPHSDAMQLCVMAGALPQSLADLARARLTRQIYIHYGSTEASVNARTLVETPEDLRWHRPVPSCGIEAVDEQGRTLAAGQVGLIRVPVFAGVTSYLHDEAASRAFFRDGYFYPGDLGVFRSDGRLALHGRVTDVVNILGSKIATGPIEEALQHQLGVSGVCVFSVQNEAAEEEIHVAIETARPIDQTRLAAALGRELQGVPDALVHFIDALPRNDMGKIQRDVLKKSAASLIAGESRQQRRRSQRLARKLDKPPHGGAVTRR